MVAAQPGQLRLGMYAGFGVDEPGQPMHEAADHHHVSSSDAPVALRGSGGRQHGWQRLAGKKPLKPKWQKRFQ